MQTILSFLLVLGVLIFVHELGHFLVARWYGVRVLTFSLGFGPKILKFTRAGTEYCISAVPLGGYVKMAGETTADERQGAPDEFLSKSKWIRFQVYLAGPVMNLVLAVVALAIVLSNDAYIAKFHSQPAVIGQVEQDGPAAAAGILVGDRIFSVNGEATENWDDVTMAVAPRANRELRLGIDRGGENREIRVVPKPVGKYDEGKLGIKPKVRPQFHQIFADRPAEAAGFLRGDTVLAVNGDRDLDYTGVVSRIRQQGEGPMIFEIERNGRTTQVNVTPEGPAGAKTIGAQILENEVEHIDLSALQALKMSLSENWRNTQLVGKTLRDLVTREAPVSQLMGPVGIAGLAGEAAQRGTVGILTLMAMISLQLALLNLMPIPVLDGGQIAILALEGVARRDLSVRVKEYFAMAGVAAILLLMVTVLYNDIARLVR